ncbi:hypothetical protein POM88_050633 [Heracleum sosnowskyi]|uniref:Uncharacterized protein n=1 Tax=Heracleum sosnowskyi TaxID=360622 RepID=A0AAD8M2R1_9APIA|nr:hypothetical protein POM88_050633 [Heracleum sosnowskyi]
MADADAKMALMKTGLVNNVMMNEATNDLPPEDPVIETKSPSMSKGKEKVLSGYAFNNDGLLSTEAMKIIDEGRLLPISKSFGKVILDLEEEIFDGVYAKDILDSAIKGTLESLMEKVAAPKQKSNSLKIKDKNIVDQA